VLVSTKVFENRTKCHSTWRCPKCKSSNGTYETITSSCDAFDDDYIRSENCKHTYWVEGADA